MERPSFIPEHATNVRQRLNLWIWEFAGGSVVQLGRSDMQGELYDSFTFQTELLEAILEEFVSNEQRYRKAIDDEYQRRESYQNYLDSFNDQDYDDEDNPWEDEDDDDDE